MKLILHGSQKIALNIFLNILDWSYLQNCKILTFKVNFLCQTLSESFSKNFIGEYQFRSPSFVTLITLFLKKNWFLKCRHQIVIFSGLISLTENVQKIFQFNICDQFSTSFILKRFYQLPVTWSWFRHPCLSMIYWKSSKTKFKI